MRKNPRSLHWLRSVLVAGVAAVALGGCATYSKCGFGGCPEDKKLLAAVQAEFAQYPTLQPPTQITIKVVDHVVYLYGQVDTDLERRMAEDVAYKVDGVNKVVNTISLTYP